ncbi:MAG: hypothetical protein ACE5PM_08345 [Candidatus Hydrothermarchaeales archaeon]
MKIPLVVDANPIVSALIGGASRELFFKKTFKFATTEFTIKAQKYEGGAPNL